MVLFFVCFDQGHQDLGILLFFTRWIIFLCQLVQLSVNAQWGRPPQVFGFPDFAKLVTRPTVSQGVGGSLQMGPPTLLSGASYSWNPLLAFQEGLRGPC
jgi:hypothetical protein